MNLDGLIDVAGIGEIKYSRIEEEDRDIYRVGRIHK